MNIVINNVANDIINDLLAKQEKLVLEQETLNKLGFGTKESIKNNIILFNIINDCMVNNVLFTIKEFNNLVYLYNNVI